MTCRILEFLSDQKGSVSSQDISEALDIPIGTLLCHIATLEPFGFVKTDGNGHQLGLQFAVFWAKTLARLEGKRDLLDRDIELLKNGGRMQ